MLEKLNVVIVVMEIIQIVVIVIVILIIVIAVVVIISNISDSKRQQTTTVDNKRLFNGFFLTRVASLQHEPINIKNHASKDIWMCPIRHRSNSGHH